jgi:hypothetical protein
VVLRDWLLARGVTQVGMESTGVYWKAPYYMLEDAMEVWLLEFLDELIAGLTTEIEVVIGPFSHQVELLDTIPGVSVRTAQGLLASDRR